VNVEIPSSIPPGRPTLQNNELWGEVLKELREAINQPADRDDVFFDRVPDHTTSTRCITEDQREVVTHQGNLGQGMQPTAIMFYCKVEFKVEHNIQVHIS